ncbi:Gti1/Pac2 family-domain-containing protein [Obelidium mucronatum]|nr:Gti1/Pac2 family-domain-containing protein [Obelidium mucronatum]
MTSPTGTKEEDPILSDDPIGEDLSPPPATRSRARSSRRAKQTISKSNSGDTVDLQGSFQHETYYGFIEDEMDALMVIEGTIHGVLTPFTGTAEDMADVEVKSGTVIIVPEKGSLVKRWRDRIPWSPSRAFTPFILYRQIEACDPDIPFQEEKVETSYYRYVGSTTGLVPTFTAKSLKSGTQLVKNGLTKRTITMVGSDGEKHRVISYYTPRDVINMKAKVMDKPKFRIEPAPSSPPEKIHPSQRRQKNVFTRAIDDPELERIVKEKNNDLVELVRRSFPDYKTAVEPPVAPESPSAKLDRYVSSDPEESPTTAWENLRKLYDSELENYYPYAADAEVYDSFISRNQSIQPPQHPYPQHAYFPQHPPNTGYFMPGRSASYHFMPSHNYHSLPHRHSYERNMHGPFLGYRDTSDMQSGNNREPVRYHPYHPPSEEGNMNNNNL